MLDYFELGRQLGRLQGRLKYPRIRRDEYGMTLPQDGPTGDCGCEICAKKNRRKKKRQPIEVQIVKNA